MHIVAFYAIHIIAFFLLAISFIVTGLLAPEVSGEAIRWGLLVMFIMMEGFLVVSTLNDDP